MLLYVWMGEDRGSGERVPAFHLYIARRSHCTCRIRLALLWVGGMPAQVVLDVVCSVSVGAIFIQAALQHYK